jgi:cell division protease FtsH
MIHAVVVSVKEDNDLALNIPCPDRQKELVKDIHDKTKKILNDNMEGFMQLATLLLEKEVIFADDLERIFGPRAGAPKPVDEEIVNEPEEVATEA